jgi:hypothetical protein
LVILGDLTRPVSGSMLTNASDGIGVTAMFEMSPAPSPYARLSMAVSIVCYWRAQRDSGKVAASKSAEKAD